MTGRARGRARGRGRGAMEEQPRRPGEQAPPGRGRGAGGPPAVGRARGRGATEEQPRRPGEQAPPGRGRAAGGPPAVGRARGRGATEEPPRPPGAPPAAEMGDLSLDEKGTSPPPTVQPAGGRRRRGDVVIDVPHTRPAHIQDKKGTAGQPVSLMANFFCVSTTPSWALYQYNVSFTPEVDHRGVRFSLLKEHLPQLIGETYAFDGMVLFSPKRLEQKVWFFMLKEHLPQLVGETFSYAFDGMILFLPKRLEQKVTVLSSKRHNDDANIQITITLTNELTPTSPTCIQLYNRIFRTSLRDVGMQRIGRNNYNPEKAVHIPEHKMSYVDYYAKKYNKTVSDMTQPLLAIRNLKKVQKGGVEELLYLLPELCSLTGLSDELRENFNLMKDISGHTRLSPASNRDSLQEFINTLDKNEKVQKDMKGWGLSYDKTLLKLEGRVMPPEKISQRSTSYSYKQQDADWSREMRGQQLISCVPLENWLLVFTARESSLAQDFLQTLEKVGGPMGMSINKPVMCELSDDRTDSYLSTMREQMNDNTQMVVCIVPNNRKDRYDAIKTFCCVDRPVPSQVIVSRTLSKQQMLMSMCTKIGIQMNCKLGGEIWAVEIPMKNIMVVGIDCYPDSLTKGKSVAGVVASMNNSLTRWYSRCTFQHTGQELIDGLKVCVQAALKKYNELNMNLPDRVIFYRDGVGDGQLAAVVEHEIPQVLETFKNLSADYKYSTRSRISLQATIDNLEIPVQHEIPQVLDTFKNLSAGYNPKVAWIVVNKRINAKFFAEGQGGLQNPMPGTVVDTEVTKPQWYDFFLVSGSVRQGTVTPCHYNVVSDTSGLKPDHMQRLTYKLCHLYYNWPGTIRVPAPCQYAHKLAFLVGQSIHTAPSVNLADRLYYL
ncbi:PIWIL1 [Branchiostoma lanceolatum]|uniref:PIWIL1 protein n=1 Tax=Branchiostoma lanceolatum TaxID=7740 RepID=A0A8J9VWG9_BRALA|nr:PIWIL1 [Branchiostoma lanceolatum]